MAHVTIAKPAYDISGVVHESAPTENVLLSGATVGIHFAGCPTCPHEGQETSTNDQGRFTLPGIEMAGFTLWVRKPGYEATPFNVAELPRDQHPDIAVNPPFVLLQQVWEGTIQCPGNFGFGELDRTFAVHRDGVLTFQYYRVQAFEDGIALYQGDTKLWYSNCPINCGFPSPNLRRGFIYRLSVGALCYASTAPFRVVSPTRTRGQDYRQWTIGSGVSSSPP